MKIIVSQAALADLARLRAFLEGKSPRAADRAVATLTAAVQSLDDFLERGRSSGAGNLRELVIPFGQSNYLMRYAYRAEMDEIVVVRVWHGRESRD